ncbi:acetolactate decarboxylase [Thiorhodococcus mannitoliphagus]|uniref:Alpha-acetolactate decarboxylase n=1 Tax=Thiorhodococcus mannitoliphagus TaxID=329406 RepID=A0A6P1DRR1_9GAMM|nr:acetolactate decarboxylase [Thiorhodococcus mannitoliphagus]NEX19611.1 acetolactate decarboxylase [Thiorhodococcus mannitoliphagus]
MTKHCRSLLLLLTLPLSICAQADEDADTLYQVSTIDALLAGVYQGVAEIADVLPHGDFGLGTFEALDGELILLDGIIYQAAASGEVKEMPPATRTPFISVTHFAADQRLSPPPDQNYETFKTWLETRLPSRNIAYAIRVDGDFKSVTYRSVPRQEQPYPPLLEASKQQRVFQQAQITGTLIGFWCPAFTKGVNVPGFHLHFLSDDRRHAGHVLDFDLTKGELEIDLTNGWEIMLPMSPPFLETDLGEDRSAALHSVEQHKSTP